MNKKSIMIITIAFFLALIIGASYAYFGAFSIDTNNVLNVNIVTEQSRNSVFYSQNANIFLEVLPNQMIQGTNNTLKIANSTQNTLNVVLDSEGPTTASTTCSYDVFFSYTGDTFYGAGSALQVVDNEFTYTLTSPDMTIINSGEQDFDNFVSSKTTPVKVATGSISAMGGTTTQSMNIDIKFYNMPDTDQSSLSNKSFAGKFYVDNVSCVSTKPSLANYIIANYESLNGTDAVSNSPWSIVHQTADSYDAGYRYIGKNPDNYVYFNDELWRIIGVENTEYCTDNDELCTTISSAPLVKIVRNDILSGLPFDFKQNGVGSSTSDTNGSNDWTDAQIMMLLNETKYYKSGYYGTTLLHDDYSLDGNDVIDSNNIIIYKNMGAYFDSSITPYPPEETSTSGFVGTSTSITGWKVLGSKAQEFIAPVKWNLYGKNQVIISFEYLYRIERNIGDAGNVYNSRATHWYGKVGLMYPSDYGFATSGGNTYNRADCIAAAVESWSDDDYANDCAFNDWILYSRGTSSIGSKTHQRLITPGSSSAVQTYTINTTGRLHLVHASFAQYTIRPTVYLKPDVKISGGTGTWDDPYILN